MNIKQFYLKIAFVVATLALTASCEKDDLSNRYNSGDEKFSADSSLMTSGGSGISKGVIYPLSELDGSGISGTVTITDLGPDGSHLFIDLANTDKNKTYPLQILLGEVSGNGEILAQLTPVEGSVGTSTTIITNRLDTGESFAYDQITGNEEFYIGAYDSTYTGSVVAQGGIGASVPLPFPCEDCAGSVSNLTLKFNGAFDAPVPIVVRQQLDNTVVFESMVSAGEEFSISGADFTPDGEIFGDFIEIFVGGNSVGQIDTTCETSIGPGLIVGDFEVAMGFSTLANGPLCDYEEPRDCEECDGKVTELTMQYLGDYNAQVRVEQHKGEVVFNRMVSPNQHFTFTGVDKKGTLSPKIKIYIDDVLHTDIHTSCSVPIGPGYVSGLFEVKAGESRNSDGPLCPVESGSDNPVEDDCSECDGKVNRLVLRYERSQTAQIRVEQKKHNLVIFDELVSPNGLIELIGQDNKGTLSTEIRIYVDNDLQEQIHTSCSVAIGPGLEFGDFEVISGSSRNGGELCRIQDSNGGIPMD